MQKSKLRALVGFPDVNIKYANYFIIVVPGIGTLPVNKWNPNNNKPHWLNELVASHLLGGVLRVWEHRLPVEKCFSSQALEESARELLDSIVTLKSGVGERCCPILLIGHSFGGVLIKQLTYSCDKGMDQARGIGEAIAGFVLMGTPHLRSESECEQLQNRFMRVFADTSRQAQPKGVPEAGNLTRLSHHFENSHQNTPMLSFYETRRSRQSGWRPKKIQVLEKDLSCLTAQRPRPIPMDVAHDDLCRIDVSSNEFTVIKDFFLKTMTEKQAALQWDASRSPPSERTIRSRDEQRSLISSSSYTDISLRASQLSTKTSNAPTSSSSGDFSFLRTSYDPVLRYYYGIPESNPSYFERDEIMQSLENSLWSSWQRNPTIESDMDQIRTFALCGGPGSGKTQIAAHFVSVNKNRYDVILWLPAQDTTKLFTAYEEIAAGLGLGHILGARDMIASRNNVREWLSESSRPAHPALPMRKRIKWLIVFDNVDETDILEEFWPLGGSGHVLLTSQHSLTTKTNFFGQLGVEIEPLDKPLALRFLTQMMRSKDLRPEQTIRAAQLAETLGGLPLVLVSVSHMINEGYLKLEDLGRIYRKKETLVSPNRTQSSRKHDAYDYVGSVIITQLERLGVGASLMDFLAVLDPDCVQEILLTEAIGSVALPGFPADDNTYYSARAELIKASLVIKSGDQLSVHRTIQELAIVRMTASRFQEVCEAVVDMLSNAWPERPVLERFMIDKWKEYDGLLPHVLRLNKIYEDVSTLEMSPIYELRFAKLLNNASWYMNERGHYTHAKSTIQQARILGESLVNEESLQDTSAPDEVLSSIYYTFGSLATVTYAHDEAFEAHKLFRDLRLKLKQKLGNTDDLLAHAYNELGNDYMLQKDYVKAEEHYKQSIATYRELKNFKELMLALPACNLGLSYWLQNRHEEAAQVVEGAIQYRESQLGKDDNESMRTGRLLYAMGNIKASQGFMEESLMFHERAFDQFTETVGRNHHRTCDVSCRIAEHYARLGRNDEAIARLDNALNVFMYRPFFKPETARTSFLKGDLLRKLGKNTEAIPYLERAKELYYELRPDRMASGVALAKEDFDELVVFWSR